MYAGKGYTVVKKKHYAHHPTYSFGPMAGAVMWLKFELKICLDEKPSLSYAAFNMGKLDPLGTLFKVHATGIKQSRENSRLAYPNTGLVFMAGKALILLI